MSAAMVAVSVAATVAALAAVSLIAGCGSAAPAARVPAAQAGSPGAPFLATSLGTGAGTWAVTVMGDSAASHNNFWQLSAMPAGSTGWKLVTPPGTADNGGLVLAAAGPSLITGFRPSQSLTYTPLTATSDSGQAWASTGPLDGALANVPDALAAAAGDERLLALLADGTAELAAPGYTRWKALATQRSVAAPSRPALRTGGPHRRRLHSLWAAAARREMLPARDSRHIRQHRRDLAGSRTPDSRGFWPPDHHGAPADPHGQPDRGPPGGRHRPTGERTFPSGRWSRAGLHVTDGESARPSFTSACWLECAGGSWPQHPSGPQRWRCARVGSAGRGWRRPITAGLYGEPVVNDAAAHLAIVRRAVPLELDGAVLAESWSNDTWVTDSLVLRVCWRGTGRGCSASMRCWRPFRPPFRTRRSWARGRLAI